MIRSTSIRHQPLSSRRRIAGAPAPPRLSSPSSLLLARASSSNGSEVARHHDHRIETPTLAPTPPPASRPARATTTTAAAAAALAAAGAISALLASAPLASAAPLPFSTPLADQSSNGSVVRALRERTKRERLFGAADADPRPLLAGRLSAARAEAGRVPTLVSIGQSESARMLLREKNLANLRRDLAYLTGAYASAVPERDVRGVVEAVERLDGALRRAGPRGGDDPAAKAEAAEDVRRMVLDLDAWLERVQAAVLALEGEAR